MLEFDHRPDATPIDLVSTGGLDAWREGKPDAVLAWLDRANFRADANQWLTLPNSKGGPGRILAGIGKKATIQSIAKLSRTLPDADYRLDCDDPDAVATLALGWGLGAYRFIEYKKPKRKMARLHVGSGLDEVRDQVEAVTLARDLISRPASDMLPHHLEQEIREIAQLHGAEIEVTEGNELLEAGFRTIHTVGRASSSPPRLIDVRWGDAKHSKVTIVGKGVCFDTGGLDLKTAAGMRTMKKDMAGAATALGLAHLVMSRRLPVRLRLLVPAVENAVAGNAYRPGDVISTYKKITVEIGNTDAEGRLILCDALALASEEKPDLIIDFATLTGAARIALGNEVSAMFCNDNTVAEGLLAGGEAALDPVWRMPLYERIREQLESPIADLCNISTEVAGGAISAALFLEAFVDKRPWAHFDIMAWNTRERPANPRGAEPNGLRAAFRYLKDRYGCDL